MKVIVKSVESKVSKAGKPYYIVTLDDDSRAVTWDSAIKGMVGEIEADIQETFDDSGRMTRKLKLPGSPEGFQKKQWGGKSPEERTEIKRMASVKAGVEFGATIKGCTINDVIEYSKRFLIYIDTGE